MKSVEKPRVNDYATYFEDVMMISVQGMASLTGEIRVTRAVGIQNSLYSESLANGFASCIPYLYLSTTGISGDIKQWTLTSCIAQSVYHTASQDIYLP